MKLGKLKEVDIRTVWAHEQYDFSKWLAKDDNISYLNDILGLTLVDVDKELKRLTKDRENVEREIRNLEVSNHVSPIAAIPFVRTALVAQQQKMGREGGIVMDGRDIGTTVFPNAELKIFVTASAEVRAQRRYDELQQKGMPADYADILKNVQERDYIDSHREVSPLRQADDALLLDNSHMTIDEQNKWLMEQFEKATK